MCLKRSSKICRQKRVEYELNPEPELITEEGYIEDSMSDVLMDLQQSQYGTASYKVNNLLKKQNIRLEREDFSRAPYL